MAAQNGSKYCKTCGRLFSWRASYGSDWPSVRFCSASCRSSKPDNRVDNGIEVSFLRLLQSGRESTNIKRRKITCEEVQLQDGEDRTKIEWRERYRRAARRLANVKELCWVEHEENTGRWENGDGKGSMRVEIRQDKLQDVEKLLLTFDNNSKLSA